MTLSPEACRRAAALLLTARRELSPIPALPEDCRPATVAEGYAIQAAVCDLRGGELAGFKIGATSQAARTPLATEEPFHGCLFADGVHAGLVLGPAMADWGRLDLAAQEVVFEKDGAEIGRGQGANALGHPLDALAWLADLGVLADPVTQTSRGLRAGDLITTGLVTPFAYAEAGTVLRADYGPLGAVELAFFQPDPAAQHVGIGRISTL